MAREKTDPKALTDEDLDVSGGMGMQDIKDTVVVDPFQTSGGLPGFQLSDNVDLTSITGNMAGQVSTVAPPGTPWARQLKFW